LQASPAACLHQRKARSNKAIVRTSSNLAQLYRDLGRDAEAKPLQKRALAIMEKAVGLDSPDVASGIDDTSSANNAYPAFGGPFALIGEGTAR
jgi:tetratricopeptide repeat protein